MQTEEKQMKMSYLIKRFVPYFKKYKWILILDLICASLTTVCELVFPMLVRYITNSRINRRNNLKNRTFLSDFKNNRLCGKFLYG